MEIGVTGANFEEFDGENSGYTILRKKMQEFFYKIEYVNIYQTVNGMGVQ